MRKVNILFVLSFVVSIFLSATAFGNVGDTPSAVVNVHFDGDGTPSDVVEEYLDCIISGDYEGALMCVKGSDNYTDQIKKMAAEQLEKTMEEQKESDGGLKEFTIIEENINDAGDAATVKVNAVAEDGSEEESEISLVKENGKWKIG